MRKAALGVAVVYGFLLSSLTFAQDNKPVNTFPLKKITAGMHGMRHRQLPLRAEQPGSDVQPGRPAYTVRVWSGRCRTTAVHVMSYAMSSGRPSATHLSTTLNSSLSASIFAFCFRKS